MSEICVDDGEPSDPNSDEALFDEFLSTTLSLIDGELEGTRCASGFNIGQEIRLCVAQKNNGNRFFRAELSQTVADQYRGMREEDRLNLENYCVTAMSKCVARDQDNSEQPRVPIALCGNLPVLFEPDNHAMSLGRYDANGVLVLESSHIKNHEQMHTLLSGVMALIWFVRYRKNQQLKN